MIFLNRIFWSVSSPPANFSPEGSRLVLNFLTCWRIPILKRPSTMRTHYIDTNRYFQTFSHADLGTRIFYFYVLANCTVGKLMSEWVGRGITFIMTSSLFFLLLLHIYLNFQRVVVTVVFFILSPIELIHTYYLETEKPIACGYDDNTCIAYKIKQRQTYTIQQLLYNTHVYCSVRS